jgi:hypothetical protein
MTDRILGLCVRLLLASIVIYVSVHLIEAVWPGLLLIVAAVAVVVAITTVFRSRNRGW